MLQSARIYFKIWIFTCIQTCCNKVTGCPLLGPLLDHLKKVLAIGVVPDHVCAVDDQYKRSFPIRPPFHCDFLQLVECTLNIQEGGGIPRSFNAEEATDVTAEVRQYRSSRAIQENILRTLHETRSLALSQAGSGKSPDHHEHRKLRTRLH